MTEIVRMPKLSDTMTEVVVAEWHKNIGDEIESGDLLAEIETDKATMEFESFQDGVLLYIGVEKGQTAPVDSILAILGEKGEDILSILEYERKVDLYAKKIKEDFVNSKSIEKSNSFNQKEKKIVKPISSVDQKEKIEVLLPDKKIIKSHKVLVRKLFSKFFPEDLSFYLKKNADNKSKILKGEGYGKDAINDILAGKRTYEGDYYSDFNFEWLTFFLVLIKKKWKLLILLTAVILPLIIIFSKQINQFFAITIMIVVVLFVVYYLTTGIGKLISGIAGLIALAGFFAFFKGCYDIHVVIKSAWSLLEPLVLDYMSFGDLFTSGEYWSLFWEMFKGQIRIFHYSKEYAENNLVNFGIQLFAVAFIVNIFGLIVQGIGGLINKESKNYFD